MDMIYEKNHIKLCGSLAAPPVYSHSARGRIFYSFPLEVRRLSGSTDTVNVVLGSEQLKELDISDCGKLCVEGQLRTWNNRRGEGAKLVITVLARELYFCDGPDENLVRLSGTLCKAPNLRITPMGRDICDLMLAVNRMYNKSDYIPCIAWGRNAGYAEQLDVGTKMAVEGRIQSREYRKKLEDGTSETRRAYEVSVVKLEEI